jgi:NAD(P)-dependent dehydrogenase (short-subunit alcohol dehydrogenase family)
MRNGGLLEVHMSKIAIVTGASRGIGRACAKALSSAGFVIYLVADGSEEELAAAANECATRHPQGEQSKYGIFDLQNSTTPEQVVSAALASFGRIDILLNNAGIRVRKPFGEFTPEDIDRVFAVNVRAALLLSQAVLPAMRRAGGGRIIHMASQLGLVADPGATVYGMSKAALIQLARNMAFELAPEGILVNAISPGPIATDYYLARLQNEPELLNQRLAAVPAKRLGKEDEVAAAVAFLATTEATYIQGHNLVIDGGFVIH